MGRQQAPDRVLLVRSLLSGESGWTKTQRANLGIFQEGGCERSHPFLNVFFQTRGCTVQSEPSYVIPTVILTGIELQQKERRRRRTGALDRCIRGEWVNRGNEHGRKRRVIPDGAPERRADRILGVELRGRMHKVVRDGGPMAQTARVWAQAARLELSSARGARGFQTSSLRTWSKGYRDGGGERCGCVDARPAELTLDPWSAGSLRGAGPLSVFSLN